MLLPTLPVSVFFSLRELEQTSEMTRDLEEPTAQAPGSTKKFTKAYDWFPPKKR